MSRKGRSSRLVSGVGRSGLLGVASDPDLVSRVADKDGDALATLYDRYGRAAYSLALNMMREREAAEDLVQDAFLEVWQKAADYREERGTALTWILTIVHNRGVDRLRTMGARRRAQERVASIVPPSDPTEAFARTWEGLMRRSVNEALRTLPAEQLEVLELAYFSGHTQKEIARKLDLPLGTVKGRARLALAKLRKHFQEKGIATWDS